MDDGWIEWKGGECPEPFQRRVSVKFRNGIVGKRMAAKFYGWDHRPDAPGYDIIAYRLV